MKNMKKTKVKRPLAEKTALAGILCAQVLAVSFIERLITAALPLPPGIKPGLSNIVTMFAVSALGLPYGLAIIALKAAFAFIISGASAAFLSLLGGLLSVLAMYFLLKIHGKSLSYTGISVICAVLHNMGQLTGASLLVQSPLYLSYAPILLVSGVIFGIITGVILKALMPVLERQKNKIIKKHENE